ncbi:DUF2652 domain-containing protein [Microbacterium invictum]|uniref:DUF2652 domain-containing protein n=1 Tax=Microbacterium invictum TaxID=515415 RepID=A0ABZ0VE96_9MICO|nr:DUF2652 domain-containing protein [Microbacterium invictum]WQB71721.1 DUF2652 domain-containing protein [Microbacterium invictum]
MTTRRTALLIADIGGYTAYMGTHRMSLAHAEVNTARLLDRIVAAAPGFDLVEIEGDAAFLSRRVAPESDATLSDVLRTAAAMHRAFHAEREYVVANLCPCGGCREAKGLTLKFVAHVGDVALQSIRGRTKPVGIDVILLHRLLKNDVSIREYVLLTDDLYAGGADLPATATGITADLEGIGPVPAHFVDVTELDAGPGPSRPGLGARLASTFSAVGRGLPYMVGSKKPRRDRSPAAMG